MPGEIGYWDTSAIVPLFCNQVTSREARRVRREFNELVIWWGTYVEVYSGATRLLREGLISKVESQVVLQKWSRVYAMSRVVQPDENVLRMAASLTERYEVRALDAFQLAAALVWCDEKPRNRTFICADKRLSEAANSAGFEVVSLL